ncbi:MAG: hypothetical protein EOP90_13540 [Lysobacteraceae bacterium]|nr:MAG: hypothetical protein EOP90_13540 [Xanthomonadaceae bacterium]
MNRCLPSITLLLALASVPAEAITFCVDDANELQATLEVALSNGDEDDVIRIEAGVYRSISPDGFRAFNFSAIDADLEISGGWTENCGLRLPGLRSTIDGEFERPGLVLGGTMDVRGRIRIHGMQFVQGLSFEPAIAGGLTINRGYDIQVESNLFRGNATNGDDGTAAGALYALSEGSITVRGNVFVDNDADTPIQVSAGAASLHCYGIPAAAAFISNTVVGNSSGQGAPGDIGGVRVYGFPNCSWSIADNILWDNTGLDLAISVAGASLRYNDIDDLGGTEQPATSTGNLSVEPGFVSGTNLGLKRSSPLVDAGTNAPAGGLPSASFDGGPRIVGARVDMGAYELERLFTNGFDPTGF